MVNASTQLLLRRIQIRTGNRKSICLLSENIFELLTDNYRRPPVDKEALLWLRVKHHSLFGLDPCLGFVKIRVSDLLLKCHEGPSEPAFFFVHLIILVSLLIARKSRIKAVLY